MPHANPVITVTYSNIKFTGVYTGVGNINADPRFVLPISYTAAPTTTGNYHLRAGSPAIDHGTNAGVTTDLDGRKRPLGKGYDMGAYESPAVRLPAADFEIVITLAPLPTSPVRRTAIEQGRSAAVPSPVRVICRTGEVRMGATYFSILIASI